MFFILNGGGRIQTYDLLAVCAANLSFPEQCLEQVNGCPFNAVSFFSLLLKTHGFNEKDLLQTGHISGMSAICWCKLA